MRGRRFRFIDVLVCIFRGDDPIEDAIWMRKGWGLKLARSGEPESTPSMSFFRSVLVASLVLLAFLAAWIFFGPGPDLPALATPAVAPPAESVRVSREEAVRHQTATAPEPAPTPKETVTSPSTPQPAVTGAPRRSAGTSVSALEQQIRSTRDAEGRVDLITELAHGDSPEALLALERLFTIERHPKVQTALIAGLLEVDPAIQPDARFRILRSALTNQPREVRTTALEVLAESKDPTARELLRKSSISDPDHEVREVAAALYKANNQ